MKKVFYLVLLLAGLSANATTPPEINEKVLKAFKETFAEAENVRWREEETHCQADFTVSEILVRATYDNEGVLLQTVRHYSVKHLPSTILAKLKLKHADKEIFGVTEIATDNELSYHIVLKDDKNWYWMRSDPYGNLVQTQKLKRGDPGAVAGF